MAQSSLARTAVNETVYALIAVWLFFLRTAQMVRPRPATLGQPKRQQASLEKDEESDRDDNEYGNENNVQTARATRYSMRVEWRWVWTEVGTVLMALCVAESSLQMVRHGFERSLHIHLAVGFSKGFALMLIMLTTVAQMAACVNLLTPMFYFVTGCIAPSSVLAGTIWFEALMFGDMNDTATLVRSFSLTGTALMLALCRYDRQARSLMSQLPAGGVLFNIESQIRKVCTAARVGIFLPPASFVLLVYAMVGNPFWRTHGILYEWYRGRFQACIALASVLSLVGGQDTKHNILLGWKLQYLETRMENAVEKAMDWILRRRATMLGQPYQGRKKAL